MLSAAQVLEVLSYDPGTGIFTRVKSRTTSLVGRPAGGCASGYVKIRGIIYLTP